MNQDELIKASTAMYFLKKGRHDVIEFLNKEGVEGEDAEYIATEAYKLFRTHRREAEEKESSKLNGKILVGVLVLAAGLIATFTTNRIWYGAIIFGGISVFAGLADKA